MHQTLLTFKHNLKAVINRISLNYSNGCLEGCNRKIKQIERTAFGYANFNFKYKEKADKSIVILLSAYYFRMFDKEPFFVGQV